MTLGQSQRHVAGSVHISRSVYSRIERGKLAHLSVMLAARIAAVLGLDLYVRVYPGAAPIRDAAQAERLRRVLDCVGPPLGFRTEVPLRATTNPPEQRSWDAVLFDSSKRTAVELEMRLYDVQAQTRRLFLKQRDDAPDQLLLIVADTRANRRVLREYAELLAQLPRLKTSRVLAQLRRGGHPPGGLMLV